MLFHERLRPSPQKIKKQLLRRVPILSWLPNYNWRKDLTGDVIGGLTVGIMHVPQGMAYASLAGVPPIVGLYASFFASTIYMFFGTARHISIGTFAVASMMTGAAIHRYTLSESFVRTSGNETSSSPPTAEELASTLTLCCAFVQLLMGILPLSFLTTYLSDQLISGYTTGSALHVFTSQLPKILGVRTPERSGLGLLPRVSNSKRKHFQSWWDAIIKIPHTNLVVLAMSIIGMAFLYAGRVWVNPWVLKRSRVPIPLELVLVILGIVASVVFHLEDRFQVKVVSTIPRGFPALSVPRFDLIAYVAGDAVSIAVICSVFVLSMGKIFAKKHKYRIDSNQEFLATGLMSAVCSFFPTYPVGASLSRSSVCEMSGANTLLYTVFSSSLLLTVILFLGPLLEPLPMCVLASIVIISLKSLFMQVTVLPKLWKISKYDFAIWIVSCVATIVTDVTWGLVIAVAFALLSIVLRQQWLTFEKSETQHSEKAFEKSVFSDSLSNISGTIYKFPAPLHFANASRFVDSLRKQLRFDDQNQNEKTKVVVDCSSVNSIDSMGLDALVEAYEEANSGGVKLLYYGFSDSMISHFEAIDFFERIPREVFEASQRSESKFHSFTTIEETL